MFLLEPDMARRFHSIACTLCELAVVHASIQIMTVLSTETTAKQHVTAYCILTPRNTGPVYGTLISFPEKYLDPSVNALLGPIRIMMMK